jgi:ferredoxin
MSICRLICAHTNHQGTGGPGGEDKKPMREPLPLPLRSRLLLALALAMVARAYTVPPTPPRGAAAVNMKLRAKQEGPGNYAASNMYVDRSCAGCGTCRAMCPGVFGSLGLKTAVQREPKDEVRVCA